MPQGDVHQEVRNRQASVQETGDEWEGQVIKIISTQLEKRGLRVVKGKKKEIRDAFWRQLYVPTKRGGVWGDIDLIVYNTSNNKVVAVISCKVSLHGRLTESLFYWLLFRDKLNRPFKFVFTTNDKGRGQGEWKSEWGSDKEPTKDRALAETYTDGVYVHNPNTKLGGIIKPIENLAADIIAWSKL